MYCTNCCSLARRPAAQLVGPQAEAPRSESCSLLPSWMHADDLPVCAHDCALGTCRAATLTGPIAQSGGLLLLQGAAELVNSKFLKGLWESHDALNLAGLLNVLDGVIDTPRSVVIDSFVLVFSAYDVPLTRPQQI